MSANTYWSPVGKGRSLDGVSSWFDTIARVVLQDSASQLLLTAENAERLDACAKVMTGCEREAVEELIEAIRKHDAVRVWRED